MLWPHPSYFYLLVWSKLPQSSWGLVHGIMIQFNGRSLCRRANNLHHLAWQGHSKMGSDRLCQKQIVANTFTALDSHNSSGLHTTSWQLWSRLWMKRLQEKYLNPGRTAWYQGLASWLGTLRGLWSGQSLLWSTSKSLVPTYQICHIVYYNVDRAIRLYLQVCYY